MELRHLRYFLAVAREENFNQAARLLHVAQSALSRQIQALEADLGVALFERLPRGVRLTPAGAALIGHAERVLKDTEGISPALERVQRGQVGVLRLGFNEIAVNHPLVPNSIRRFRGSHPDVEIRLTTLPSPEQIEAILKGAQDAGFLYRQPDTRDGLSYRKIIDYTMMLAVPAHHPLATRPVVRMADLRDEDFVWGGIRERYPWIHDLLIAECLSKGGFAPRIIQESSSTDTVLSLIGVGSGIGLVHSTLRERGVPNVVVRPLADMSLVLPLYLVWNPENRSPVVKEFVAMVLDLLKSLPAGDKRRTRRRGA